MSLISKDMYLRGQQAAEALEGTAQSLHDVASDEEQDDPNFCAALDELVFCCAECGWWCETGEACEGDSGEDVCSDCSEA